MQKLFLLASCFIFLGLTGIAQRPVSIVPYPKQVTVTSGHFEITNGQRIAYRNKDLADAAELLVNDLYLLYGVKATYRKGDANVVLDLDPSLETEEYTIEITGKKAVIKGGSYNAVCMGITSLLQLGSLQNDNLRFPVCSIKDKPTSEYRGFMLDVARQWHNIETVKQVVELCRWYKIRYLQIHLTDDQLFTFPSKAYPRLASKDKHYTLEELEELVEFAKKRGIIIIPEFDAPGHTTAMRRNMPELFGDPGLGVIDMTNEKVYEAMETIMKEMMDVFYNSPYFHIGADEAWLGNFEKTEKAKAYVKKMGFDNAHDIYLNFIVRMHNIVKKHGRKTLVWESFQGTGSRKVKIPTDLIVFAWETAYQRPESLLKNGYTIINASWKPTYVTPGWRWRPDYIYNWNLRRWENHWNATPAYHNPIQLDESTPIMGGQMCSWEMSEKEQIASIHQRVPAISEVLWNGEAKKEYAHYRKRYLSTDKKYNRLIFPVDIEKTGFTEPDYEGLYFNRENRFSGKATLTLKPLLPDTKITYTTDGKVPGPDSPACPETINLDNDLSVKFAVFNKKEDMIGYKTVKYEVNAIVPSVSGNTLALRDTNIYRNKVEFIDEVVLSLKNLKKGATLRYTIDGSNPKLTSQPYTSAIKIEESQTVKVICYYEGKPYGLKYECQFIRKDYENNMTTGKATKVPNGSPGSVLTAKKATDGFVDIDGYWDNQGGAKDMIVDLGELSDLSKIVLYTYWDGNRYYQYNVELSVDGKSWEKVIDRSENTEKADENGYADKFQSRKARYIKVNMLKNSANPSMHIVEIRAY